MINSDQDIQSVIVKLVKNIVEDWDDETDGEISSKSQLGQDIGFSSVDFVELIVAIEEEFGRKFGFHNLLMPNDKYVDDLSIEEIVDFMGNKGVSKKNSCAQQMLRNPDEVRPNEKINESKLESFRRTIPTPAVRHQEQSQKNPKAIFILTSPRSGSTLLRVLLAGHPKIFAPPELHLLDYVDLGTRKSALSNELNDHLLEGTIRAIMQIKKCSPEIAKKLMEHYENQNVTTKEMYNLIQKDLGEKILVDKTPTYGIHLDILRRAEEDFCEPLYIHLIRNPYGMIRSFVDAKIDQLVPFMRNSSYGRFEIAELIWIITQQNIMKFLQEISPRRWCRVKFEELVQTPETSMKELCAKLDITFHRDMLEPYKEKEKRMTDGVQTASRFSGDLKFHLHEKIEADTANRWKHYHTSDFLSETAIDIATSVGYQLEVKGQ